MSIKTSLERFDELIKIGKTLLPFQNNLKYLAEKEKWQANCQSVLERVFGKNSVHLKSFQKVLTYGNPEAHITHGISIMEGAKEELAYRGKADKLDKIEKEIRKERAEAERRAAVVETKLWGSVIELIDMQREELKKRSLIDQEILKIRREIGEIKSLLNKLLSKKEI